MFSTKYFDDQTTLAYFGYRYYAPRHADCGGRTFRSRGFHSGAG